MDDCLIMFLLMTDDTTTLHHSCKDDAPAADQPLTKRQKVDGYQAPPTLEILRVPLLLPSHALLGIARDGGPDGDGFIQTLETIVGISKYVGQDIPPIQVVIKQRCLQHTNIHSRTYVSHHRFSDSLVFGGQPTFRESA